MKRTIETASIATTPHRLKPVPVDGLREIDHGGCEGMRRSEVEAQFPELGVSHKATMRLLISSLLGFDACRYRDRPDQQSCCLNILDLKDPVRTRLMLFNNLSHDEGVPSHLLSSRLSKCWDLRARLRQATADAGLS